VDAAIAAGEAALENAESRLAAAEAQLGQRAAAIEAQAAELASRRARIDELERVADHLSERVVERTAELNVVKTELARLRAEGEDRMRSLAVLAEELEAVRRQARGQATRIRLRALRDAVELSERIGELTRRPTGMRERLLTSLQEAISRIAEQADAEDVAAEVNGYGRREPGELFEGIVEVEIGPLSDFSQLVGFEDAAGAIGATSEISVRRFAQGRATLDMRLSQPVELLRELEERAPFEFRVRDTRPDRLVLDVDEPQAAEG
jgi:multidrug efflux pump subunit AcrA (membrane-fusion protein)